MCLFISRFLFIIVPYSKVKQFIRDTNQNDTLIEFKYKFKSFISNYELKFIEIEDHNLDLNYTISDLNDNRMSPYLYKTENLKYEFLLFLSLFLFVIILIKVNINL